VTFYEVPMIGGLARMGKWFIDSGMRRGTPKPDREHVITVYGGTDAWKQRVGFRDPKAAYSILLDSNGRVAWRYAGGLDEEAYKRRSHRKSQDWYSDRPTCSSALGRPWPGPYTAAM